MDAILDKKKKEHLFTKGGKSSKVTRGEPEIIMSSKSFILCHPETEHTINPGEKTNEN